MSEPRLVHEWTTVHGKRHRLIAMGGPDSNCDYEVERCDRDGVELWTPVMSTRLRDNGATRYLCQAIDQLAGSRRALTDSMSYAKGERQG